MASQKKTGVLIVNLGTPEGTDYFSIRRYLSQFLKDRRIIEMPRCLWYPVLYGIILNVRPQRVGIKYKRIWNYAKNESPLRSYTRSQAEKLHQLFNEQNISVTWAMRYGQPSIEKAIDELFAENCEHIFIFPLYPQYSATTTASVYDDVFRALKKKRVLPSFSTISSYADDPHYIEALANTVLDHFNQLNYKPEHLMAAFHGIPLHYAEKGDPYQQECQKTFEALRQKLGFESHQMSLTFQSRFGPRAWLQPYTEPTVIALAQAGTKSLAVINPGFASDCLETVDEIAHEVAEQFYKNGGEKFSHIPCLNDSDAAITLYKTLIDKALHLKENQTL